MEADRIRNFLRNCGVCLIDEKGRRGRAMDVTTWKYVFWQTYLSLESGNLQQSIIDFNALIWMFYYFTTLKLLLLVWYYNKVYNKTHGKQIEYLENSKHIKEVLKSWKIQVRSETSA